MAWAAAALTPFAGVVAVFASRRWWAMAGTSPAERTMPMPGDEIVPNAPLVTTRAIGIDASVATTWAWLVQIGQDRGGFYSHAWLENLVGCRMRNADRIVPEWQHREVGDGVWMHPALPPLRVAVISPPHTLVLVGVAADSGGHAASTAASAGRRDATSWAFRLIADGGDRCRLLVRTRTDWRPGWWRAALWRGMIDPGHFVMERAMLRGIARRARRGSVPSAPPSDDRPDDA